jgi:hypothetical protein
VIQTEFEEIYEQQTAHERAVLIDRAAAYATHGDRLGNFYAGAELNEVTALEFALSLMTKHIIALRDMIKVQAIENPEIDDRIMLLVTEYTGDVRNYALLLKALYAEARREQESIKVLMEGSDGEPGRGCRPGGLCRAMICR